MKKLLAKNKAAIIRCLFSACIFVVLIIAFAGCGAKSHDEHTHSYIAKVIGPTCTEAGYTLHTCACGESYKDTLVDKLGHTPQAAIKENEVAADCTTGGSYDYVVYCKDCDEILSVEHKTTEKLGHNYEDGVCSVCGAAEIRYNPEDIEFTLSQDGNYYTVSGFNGTTYANIPETYLGVPVTAIGSNAFYKCGELTSVYIPGSVTSIGSYAFEECANLTSVTIEEGLISIGNSAFYKCVGLTDVVLPRTVTTIGSDAFASCTNLASFTFHKGLTSIASSAFNPCAKLSTIYFMGDITDWCGNSGVGSIMKAAKNKKLYFNGEEVTELIIPSGITSLGKNTFYGCVSIKSVTVGADVTTVGDYAFANCGSLETVYWNATACIGGYFYVYPGYTDMGLVFQSCSKLTTVIIGNNVRSIPPYLFDGVNSMKTVILSDSVTAIGEYAFLGCYNLVAVYYLGAQSDYEKITVGEKNTNLTNKIYVYSQDAPSEAYNSWYYDEDGNMVIWD